MRAGITIDVPDLAAGIAFYGGVFGLSEVARPIATYAILDGGGLRLGIMEKAPGTRPTPAPGPVRDYARHWTPVHLDFHVDDLAAIRAAVIAAGGRVEADHTAPGHPAVAFCADPFGHGFCLIGPAS